LKQNVLIFSIYLQTTFAEDKLEDRTNAVRLYMGESKCCLILLTYLLTCLLNLLTYLLTYSMEHSPSWEANRFSASQDIPRILWNPKFRYRIHKCQLDPIHTPTYNFLKIHLNIILPSTPGSSKWALPSGFPTKTLYTPLPSPTCYMPRPSHSSRCDHLNNIGWGVRLIKLIIM